MLLALSGLTSQHQGGELYEKRKIKRIIMIISIGISFTTSAITYKYYMQVLNKTKETIVLAQSIDDRCVKTISRTATMTAASLSAFPSPPIMVDSIVAEPETLPSKIVSKCL